MTEKSIMPEIDVFNLPVFKDADIFPMLASDELAELAEDIKENGLNEPVIIAQVDGQWMLVDGRNRLAACKLAEITPNYTVVEGNADKLKSLVWSWNGPRRHLTSSQKAMAYAMMYPEGKRGGDRKSNQFANLQFDRDEKIDASAISRARFILKHDLDKAMLVRDGHPDFPLSRTYDDVKADIEDRARKAEEEREKLAQLNALRSEYSDLAALVDEGRVYLDEALNLAEDRKRKADEEIKRQREEEEARLEEAERARRDEERKAQEYYEQCLSGFFYQFNSLISGASIVGNDAQVKQLEQYSGEWDRFSQQYRHHKRDVLLVLQNLQKNLPKLIKYLEIM